MPVPAEATPQPGQRFLTLPSAPSPLGRLRDHNDAKVICKMLGFSNVTEHYSDICNFGLCPPNGTPFSMSGLKCTGNEIHIEDCVHDSTVSSYCGRRGFTQNTGDIVGVECA